MLAQELPTIRPSDKLLLCRGRGVSERQGRLECSCNSVDTPPQRGKMGGREGRSYGPSHPCLGRVDGRSQVGQELGEETEARGDCQS